MAYNIEDAISELKAVSCDTPKKPELPDDKLLAQYEKRIGRQLPEDYKQFLKQASDVFVGDLNPLIVTASGNAPGELAVAITDARAMGLPRDWLPICEDNGNYYCLTDDGTVRFWSHDGATDEKWHSLAVWIKTVWIDRG